MKNNPVIQGIIVLVTLLIGFLLRIPGLINETFAYTYDVGRDMLKVREIISTFDIPLIGQTTGLPGLFYGPWWYYVLTIPFVLSGSDPRGVLLFMILTGVVSIFLAYRIGLSLSAPLFGLVFAVLIAVSQELIGLSAQIWNPNVIPLYLLVFLYCAIRSHLSSMKILWYLLAGFFAGLILDSEIVYGVLFMGGLIAMLATYRRHVTRTMIGAGLAGLLIILMPRVVFELKHNFIMTNAVISFIQTGRDGGGAALQLQPVNSFMVHWHMFLHTVAANSSIIAGIVSAFIVLTLIRYWNTMTGLLKMLCIFLLTQVTVSFIGLSFFFEEIWPHYMAGIPVLYTGILALSVHLLYVNHKRFQRWIIAGVFTLCVISVYSSGFSIKTPEQTRYTDPAEYGLARSVVEYVYTDAAGEPFKYIVYTPPVHDFTYEYLFAWYGEKTYGYTPVESSDLFYVILEPDREKPERLVEWLELRKNDGVIVDTQEMPGGIMIQRRYVDQNN